MQRPQATIARFDSLTKAERAHAKLTSAGIEAELRNEFAAGADVARGALEVQLLVPESDAERAMRLLGGWSADAASAEVVERCLVCQSSLVEVRSHALPLRIGIALLLQALPLPRAWFESRGRRCGVCGHEWRDESTQDAGA